MTLELVKPGRLLIIASVSTSTSRYVEQVWGGCRMEVDGRVVPWSWVRFKYDDEGEETLVFDAVEGAGQSATMTAVSDVYPAGRRVVGIECSLLARGEALNGTDGTVRASVDVSAVALSDR